MGKEHSPKFTTKLTEVKMKDETALNKIFIKFNLLSDADFKSWMLNNYDELIKLEREQIVNAFSEGTRMVDIHDELSARFNACVYYADTFNDE